MSQLRSPRPTSTRHVVSTALAAVVGAGSLGCGDDVLRFAEMTEAATVGAVDRLILRDADSTSQIQDLIDTAPVSIAKLNSTQVSVEAVVSGRVASVEFLFDSSQVLEHQLPFTYPGDIDGKLKGFRAEVGSHSVTATPYSALGAQGQRGASFETALVFVE